MARYGIVPNVDSPQFFYWDKIFGIQGDWATDFVWGYKNLGSHQVPTVKDAQGDGSLDLRCFDVFSVSISSAVVCKAGPSHVACPSVHLLRSFLLENSISRWFVGCVSRRLVTGCGCFVGCQVGDVGAVVIFYGIGVGQGEEATESQ